MSSEPRAFAAIDQGTATIAVSLIGRFDGRWRLLGAHRRPRRGPADALLERLRVRLVDGRCGPRGGAGPSRRRVPRPTCPGRRARPRAPAGDGRRRRHEADARAPRRRRDLGRLAGARRWRSTARRSVAVARPPRRPDRSAVLAGSGEPPGGDERPLIPDLVTIIEAAAQRRPDLTTVLVGGLAEPGGRMEAAIRPERPGATLTAPSPAKGGGAALRGAARLAARRTRATAGARSRPRPGRWRRCWAAGSRSSRSASRPARASPPRPIARGWTAPSIPPTTPSAVVADAALLPRGFGDAHLDAIIGWLSHLARPAPRAGSAARARPRAMGRRGRRRRAAAPGGRAGRSRAPPRRHADVRRPPPARSRRRSPAAPGAWRPAAGVALAAADVIRRPGVRALGQDHARLLAPLGTIPDPAERRLIIEDLRDEIVLPLGSVLMPAGLRVGRSAGRLVVRGAAARCRWSSWSAASSWSPCRPASGRSTDHRSATPSTSGRASGAPASRWPAASPGCWSTCATCRFACPTGSSSGARRWRLAGRRLGGDSRHEIDGRRRRWRDEHRRAARSWTGLEARFVLGRATCRWSRSGPTVVARRPARSSTSATGTSTRSRSRRGRGGRVRGARRGADGRRARRRAGLRRDAGAMASCCRSSRGSATAGGSRPATSA